MDKALFRGKCVDGEKCGQWVYGYFTMLFGQNLIVTNDGWTSYRVDPDTVGRYIGTDDMYDQRIFEGDIIMIDWLSVYRVVYEDEVARFDGLSVLKNCPGFTTFDDGGNCFEIIGNIYDNPGLAEGKITEV